MKNKIKAITYQIFRLRSTGYPSALIPIEHWDWKWNKQGNVEYNNFKTLINYLKSLNHGK